MRLRERWVLWRNARLSDPRFQSWAARFLLTRPVARRQSVALFDTVAGFVYSQILAACVEIDLVNLIGDDTIDSETLADRAGLSVAGADRLLKAAAALDLTESVGGGRYALGTQGAALRGNPGVAAMVAHHALLYTDLADPVGLLRAGSGKLAAYWRYAPQASGEDVEGYSRLMAASQQMVAAQVLAAYDLGRHRRLLDVGGGQGAFVTAVAKEHPKLELSVFDLPAVADRARANLGDLAKVHAGSFLADELPKGADIITLVRILHDHDDDDALTLLRAIYAALPDEGTVLIAEPMADAPGARKMGDAYFGMYLLAMGSGRPRRPSEIVTMLERSGFRQARRLATALPLVASLIVARKSVGRML